MDHEKESGRIVGCAEDQKSFQLEISNSTDMIPGSAQNIHMYRVPQCFGRVMWGKGVVGSFFYYKFMVIECCYLEMWKDFF